MTTSTPTAAGSRRQVLTALADPRLAPLASLAGLVVLLLVAAVVTPAFYSPTNLANVSRQAAILGVVAIGQTFVLLVRGLDLSVGAVMGLAMIVAAEVTGGRDAAVPLALAVGLGAGFAIGAINAFLVVARKVPPFVATLAMLILIEGARLAWTQGIPSGSLPPGLRVLGGARVGPLPSPLVIMVAVAVIAALVLTRTSYGRRVYAVGANDRAAAMSGIRVGAVTASAYVVSSVLAVLAGFMLSGYIGYVDRYLGRGFELDAIAAAVVGGVSLAGGRGTVGGTLAGVALITALLNLVVLLDAGVATQQVIKGVVIVGAVAVQQRALREAGQ